MIVVDRIADPWGPRTPYGSTDGDTGSEWPARVDTSWIKARMKQAAPQTLVVAS